MLTYQSDNHAKSCLSIAPSMYTAVRCLLCNCCNGLSLKIIFPLFIKAHNFIKQTMPIELLAACEILLVQCKENYLEFYEISMLTSTLLLLSTC